MLHALQSFAPRYTSASPRLGGENDLFLCRLPTAYGLLPLAPPVKFAFALCASNSLKSIEGPARSHFLRKGKSHLNGKHYKLWLLATILTLALVNVQSICAQDQPQVTPQPSKPAAAGVAPQPNKPAVATAGLTNAQRDKILSFFRQRNGLRDDVKLSLDAQHTSPVSPGFIEAIITLDDGKQKAVRRALISKDVRYLIVVQSSVVDLQRSSDAEMAGRIRETFKIPPTTKVAVGEFRTSPSPDFKQGTLNVDDNNGHKQEFNVLFSRDGKHLMVGELYNLAVDQRAEALRTISLRDVPGQGPANAPVTIVEYADLECPMCARVHEFLETKVVPHYGNKLRVVFKEFPLPMHDWSMTAAVACQCAYQINHDAYVPLRTAIFRNQQMINIANLRESLLSFGEQAGLDRVQLAGCLDAEASLPRVQRDAEEGKRLGVDRTPTLYINGKMMVGLPSEDAYFQTIDEFLKSSKH